MTGFQCVTIGVAAISCFSQTTHAQPISLPYVAEVAVPVIVSDKKYERRVQRLCDWVIAHKAKVLKDATRGLLATTDNGPDRMSTVMALYDGADGCVRDRAFAVAVLERSIGPKLTPLADPNVLHQLVEHYWSPPVSDADEKRGSDLADMFWLISNRNHYMVTSWPWPEQRQFLERPENWAFAQAKLAEEGPRAEAVIRTLLDPESSLFDPKRGMALSAAPYLTYSPDIQIAKAKLFLVGNGVERSIDKAEKAVKWMVNDSGLRGNDARHIMRTIALERFKSSDPVIRQSGWAGLVSGGRTVDPNSVDLLATKIAQTGGLLEAPALPAGVVLHTGPERFTDDDYPPSSMRTGESGTVSASAIFGPDGALLTIQTTGASLTLREATAHLLQRRTGIAKVKFDKFPGRYVRVPMPSITYRILEESESVPPKPDGKITIYGIHRRQVMQDMPVAVYASGAHNALEH